MNDAADLHTHNPLITQVLVPRARDLGEFMVRRVLPFTKQRMVGPWIFFDHMGPVDFAPGEGINVRPHPHINLATVTYLFAGSILHRDSLGNELSITPGAINLMVAGKGITHSERTAPELRETGQRMNGLQLWLALPEADEEIDPAFYHYPAEDIPAVTVDNVRLRVLMGSAYGVTSPVKTYSPILYMEADLAAGQHLTLPDHIAQRAVYVVSGTLDVGGTPINSLSMAVFKTGAQVTLHATQNTTIAVIGGDPVGERHMFWNFISSRPDRLEQAKADWKAGRFPTVPNDDKEFIPLPE